MRLNVYSVPGPGTGDGERNGWREWSSGKLSALTSRAAWQEVHARLSAKGRHDSQPSFVTCAVTPQPKHSVYSCRYWLVLEPGV